MRVGEMGLSARVCMRVFLFIFNVIKWLVILIFNGK